MLLPTKIATSISIALVSLAANANYGYSTISNSTYYDATEASSLTVYQSESSIAQDIINPNKGLCSPKEEKVASCIVLINGRWHNICLF